MIRNILRATRSVAADRKGVTAAEYAILAVGIVIIVGAGVTAFSGPMSGLFTNLGTQITTAQTAASSTGSGGSSR